MILKHHNIFRKILLSTALLILGTYSAAYFGLKNVERQARLDMGSALNTVLQSINESQATWIEDKKSFLKLAVKKPAVISAVKKLVSKRREKEYLLENKQLKELRQYFNAVRTEINDIGFFIISTDNINIASMRDENIGHINIIFQQRPDLIKKALNGETVFVPPILSDVSLHGKSIKNSSSIFFVTPIKYKDKVLALLSIRLNPAQDFTRSTQVGRIGKTGETYAINQSGLIISNSRFNHHLHQIGLLTNKEDQTILNIRISDPGGNMLDGFKLAIKSSDLPLTVMAQSATSGVSDINIQGYRDYRGVRVLGAWLWNPGLGYGLTTEIDEQEALKGYLATKKTMLIIIITSLLLSILLVSIIYWLEKKSKLILKESHDTLEQKVKERTSELNIANIELEKNINNLKYLEGIIPICGYCKSIRNDEGSWDMLEKYLSHNTEAKFSHGICPKCEKIIRAEAGVDEKT